jgi:hypothetical protein
MIFPDDCTTSCIYHSSYDLSIDDFVYVCKLMEIEVDIGASLFRCKCPLESEGER